MTRNLTRVEDYQARKLSGRCTYPGCPKAAGEESLQCDRHTRAHRSRQNRSAKAVRTELSNADKCVRCRKRSSTYLCPACKVTLGVTRPLSSRKADNTVDNSRRATPNQWRPEPGSSWKRFRGKAKRGAPSLASLDEQDLKFAAKDLEKAAQALAYAHSDEVQALPRAQRVDVLKAALAFLDRAERWFDEVRERHAAGID